MALIFLTPDAPTFDDDFTGVNGDPPDVNKWTDLTGDCKINNNKLRCLVGSPIHSSSVVSLAEISGDFDIRVTVDGGTGLPFGGMGGEIHFVVYNKDDPSDELDVFIDCNTGGSYHGRVWVDGGQVQAGSAAHSGDYTVRFRITRVGTNVSMQYDKNVGSSWSNLVSNYNWGINDNVKIRLWVKNYSSYPSFSGDWDDFNIEELTFDDDFTGVNESSWDSVRWTADGANDSVNDINDNRGRQSIASGAHLAQMNNNVQFPGNLDIQIDWFKILGPSTNWWTAAVIAAVLDGPNAGWEYSMMRLYSSGQKLRSDLRTPTHTWYEFSHSTNSGKFRITREGATMKGFYWNGDSWVDPWDNWPDTSGTIDIRLATKTVAPAATIEWDNLISV